MATLEERLAKAQKGTLEQRLANAQVGKSDTAIGAGADKFSRTLLNNLFGFPSEAGKFAVKGLELPTKLFLDKEPAKTGVTKALGNIPKFTIEGAAAGIRSLPALFPGGEKFSERKERELLDINTESERMDAAFPKTAAFAGHAGDIATIFTGRVPFLSKIEKGEAWLAGKKFADAVKNPGAAGELGNIAKNVLNSPGIRSLMRGTGRVGEAGLEAAVIEALTGDDPLTAAAYVAGGQAVGSSMLTVSKGLVTGGPMKAGAKLTLTAGAFFGLLQTLKEGTPGGSDNPIATIKESFEHVLLLLIAGGVATAAGAGRIRRTDAVTWPRSAEFISTLPRANMISLVSGWVNASPDEQQTIESTLSQLQQDPEFFGPELTDRLLKALESGKFTEALREEL